MRKRRLRVFPAKSSNLRHRALFLGSGIRLPERILRNLYICFRSASCDDEDLCEGGELPVFLHQSHAAGCQNVLFSILRFTFRKGCLNPAVAIAFQIFTAASNQSFALFYSSAGLIVGEVVGALCAATFYTKFYHPLLK